MPGESLRTKTPSRKRIRCKGNAMNSSQKVWLCGSHNIVPTGCPLPLAIWPLVGNLPGTRWMPLSCMVCIVSPNGSFSFRSDTPRYFVVPVTTKNGEYTGRMRRGRWKTRIWCQHTLLQKKHLASCSIYQTEVNGSTSGLLINWYTLLTISSRMF